MKIKVMPFLQKKGNRVGQAAIEFMDESDDFMRGSQIVGFTICDDPKDGLFVLFPSTTINNEKGKRQYYFIWQLVPGFIDNLQTAILDAYESMIGFNAPRMVKNVEQK